MDGSWSDPAKWSPAGVPAATDNVQIVAAGAYTVILQGSVTVAQLSVGGNGGNPALWVQGSSAKGNAALRVNGGATNAGVIRLESSGGATTSNLTLPSGTLVNQGTIEINAGTGGQRQLSADLDNRGELRISAPTTLPKATGVYSNTGTLSIAAGQSLTISGGSQVFNQNGGTLAVGGSLMFQGSTANLTGSSFNFNGGEVSGNEVISLSAVLNIAPGATGTASFRLRGRCTLSGNVAAGQTVWVNGTTKTDAVLTWTGGLANAGTLRLESSEAAVASNLVFPSGTLINTGLIEVKEGSGGGRLILGNLDNQGAIEVTTSTRLAPLSGSSGATIANLGSIRVSPTDTLTLSVVTFINQELGTIDGGGLLVLDRTILAGTGTVATNVEAYENTLSPGSLGMGILRIAGSYYQDPFSELNIDIDGTAPGTGYDRLEVTGEAYLDGGFLNLRVRDSYQPSTCDQFTVLSYGSWVGIFEDIQKIDLAGELQGLGLAGGLRLKPRFNAASLDLLVGPADTRINIGPTELNLAEGGPGQSYRVCLGSRPDAQVRIVVSPDAQVRVSPTELIFAEAAWSGVQSVAVNAVDDALAEGPHTGIITHSASSRDNDFDRIQISRVVAHVEDNETVPSLSVGDVSVVEGNSGNRNLSFAVSLSNPSSQTITVTYATANGTATAGSDYTAANGTLTFNAGQTSKTVSVSVRGDRTLEPDETFFLNLSNPSNATISDAQGIGTITNNDGPAKVVAENLIGEGRLGVANYPNPFNPSTQIVYTLTEEAPVRLAVYNALGQQLRVLVAELQVSGSYEVQWDGRDEEGQQVGGGRYFYRLEAGEQVTVGKMSLVK